MVGGRDNSIKNNILRQEKEKDPIAPAWLRQKWFSNPTTFLGSSASAGGVESKVTSTMEMEETADSTTMPHPLPSRLPSDRSNAPDGSRR